MKLKLKKGMSIVITIVITALVCFILVAVILRPQRLSINKNVNLGKLSDGQYIGICQNKLLFAVVKVEMKNQKIEKIDILEHKDSYMNQAKQIAEKVRSNQSLEVDTIAGASLTSDTVLKAIENAVEKPK